MQKKLQSGLLLGPDGNLLEAGYATELVKDYNPENVRTSKMRLKEWDYYYIGNNDYGLALTIADNYYHGLGSISFLDFANKDYVTKSVLTIMPKGRTNLPRTSKIGDVHFRKKNLRLEFLNDGKTRRLIGNMKDFRKGEDIKIDVILSDEPQDSMVIATPFKKPKHFYYNQKINCLRAEGSFKIGDREYVFAPDSSFGVLDWGRGVWTYKNTWYWSSLSSVLEGVRIGFNFGYGFGDTSAASENMVFYDGKHYKLDDVRFEIPSDSRGRYDYLKTWKILSGDGRVNLDFEPVFDRYDNINALIIASEQHQVFGKFSGTLPFEDRLLEINGLVGFAERVSNRW
ncbi:MAG: DUF2804 domain-containing protein [Bacilli bacterium]